MQIHENFYVPMDAACDQNGMIDDIESLIAKARKDADAFNRLGRNSKKYPGGEGGEGGDDDVPGGSVMTKTTVEDDREIGV